MTTKKHSGAGQETRPLMLGRRSLLRGSLAGVALFSLGWSGCDRSADEQAIPTTDLARSGRPPVPADADARVPVLWIETGVCTGCAEALLDTTSPTIAELLDVVKLEFQETLMDLSATTAMDRLDQVVAQHAGEYLLIIDGTTPTGEFAALTTIGVTTDGTVWTAEGVAKRLAAKAKAVIALGTCASWGGIPGSGANPFSHRPIADVVGTERLIRIPGCPPHADWIAGSLSALLQGKTVELDDKLRPTAFYAKTIHEQCPRLPHFMADEYATALGDPELCLVNVGCKGPFTKADCPTRKWNGQDWCIGANHPCIGCASPGFPDASGDKGT